MDPTFFDGHDELYHHAKFGKDRTTRAGCRCENVMFGFFLLVTLRVRSAVRSRGVPAGNNNTRTPTPTDRQRDKQIILPVPGVNGRISTAVLHAVRPIDISSSSAVL